MYDLNLIPIHLEQGQLLQKFLGFRAEKAPRRAARSRAEDLLILSLTNRGTGLFTPEMEDHWLERLAYEFYKSSGSVTAVLRTLVETINLSMLELNLKTAKDGKSVRGTINLAAIHRRHLYLVQSGLTHAFALTQEGLQHFTDGAKTDRGLGLSRTPAIRYFQADMGTGGYLFMTDFPSEGWNEETLIAGEFPDLDQLRRRLLHQAPTTFRLDLVQILLGEGNIHLVQPTAKPAVVEEPLAEEPETSFAEDLPEDFIPDVQPEVEASEPDEVTDTPILLDQAEPLQDDDELGGPDENVLAEQPKIPALDETTQKAPVFLPTSERLSVDQVPKEKRSIFKKKERRAPSEVEAESQTKVEFQDKVEKVREGGLRGLASFFDWWHKVREKTSSVFRDILVRVAPGDDGDVPKFSQGTLILIAVIVPLVVVGIALGVYLSRGKTLQYQYYFEQAELASQYAMAAEDPNIARDQWTQVIDHLDAAGQYRDTDEINELREKAQSAMDMLDGAIRLTYRPAISGPFLSEINITRIISYGMDLYLFDANGGRVIHATRGSQGYTIDSDFVCSPGNYGGGHVDDLVDMVSLPINNPYQAQILAMDALGSVVYCAPGQPPVVQTLPSFSDGGSDLLKIAYENNNLYILSPSSNSVFVYTSTNGQFLEPPYNFFDSADPAEVPDIRDVVDLAVNGRELYFLRSDGKIFDCIYTGLPGNPLTCEAPVTYVDGRMGKDEQAVAMPEVDYVSVLYTPPPDPSISILDADNADIYRFSLRFRLYQRLRPDLGAYEIDSTKATAFTIGIDRIAFIAFGNQVFYAIVE